MHIRDFLFESIGSSGGGSTGYGGCGGGYLHITVSEFQNDGAVMVDGQDAQEYRGGGGSAGSMQVHVTTIEGTGRYLKTFLHILIYFESINTFLT